jgi:hypothetical protein
MRVVVPRNGRYEVSVPLLKPPIQNNINRLTVFSSASRGSVRQSNRCGAGGLIYTSSLCFPSWLYLPDRLSIVRELDTLERRAKRRSKFLLEKLESLERGFTSDLSNSEIMNARDIASVAKINAQPVRANWFTSKKEIATHRRGMARSLVCQNRQCRFVLLGAERDEKDRGRGRGLSSSWVSASRDSYRKSSFNSPVFYKWVDKEFAEGAGGGNRGGGEEEKDLKINIEGVSDGDSDDDVVMTRRRTSSSHTPVPVPARPKWTGELFGTSHLQCTCGWEARAAMPVTAFSRESGGSCESGVLIGSAEMLGDPTQNRGASASEQIMSSLALVTSSSSKNDFVEGSPRPRAIDTFRSMVVRLTQQ